MKHFIKILKQNMEWNTKYNKKRNFITIWRDNNRWNKQYNMDIPEWSMKDIMDPSVYSDPEYLQWFEKLSVEKKKVYGRKLSIVNKKVSNAIEDELIKRGGSPETSRL